MFADPQSITISDLNGGSAISLPKVIDEPLRSVYKSNDGLTTLTISQRLSGTTGTTNSRTSALVRLETKFLGSDPLNAERNIYQQMAVSFTIDHPEFGFSVAQMVNRATALVTLLSASSYAAVTKLAGGEH
jgi:hypothetical protein